MHGRCWQHHTVKQGFNIGCKIYLVSVRCRYLGIVVLLQLVLVGSLPFCKGSCICLQPRQHLDMATEARLLHVTQPTGTYLSCFRFVFMFNVLGSCHVEIWVQRPCATVYPYWADKNVGTVTASVMASNAHADILCQTIKIMHVCTPLLQVAIKQSCIHHVTAVRYA